MYEAYWKLTDNPFASRAAGEPFFPSETHQAALLKIRYVIEHRKGTAAVIGARGDAAALLDGLAREFRIPRAVLTCGEDGSHIFDRGRSWRQPAVATELCDTVGAGDAMTLLVLAVPLHLAGGDPGLPLRQRTEAQLPHR